jgi:hypothetical protein
LTYAKIDKDITRGSSNGNADLIKIIQCRHHCSPAVCQLLGSLNYRIGLHPSATDRTAEHSLELINMKKNINVRSKAKSMRVGARTHLSEHGAGELGHEGVLDVLAHGRGAREHHPDRRQVVRRCLVALGHGDDDGRHERRDGDPVPLHELHHPGEVEAAHDHDGGADAEPAHHDGVERVDVEHGQRAEDDVVGGEADVGVVAVDLLRNAGAQAPVRQHHALWEPRRAGRVRQRHHVVGVELPVVGRLLVASVVGDAGHDVVPEVEAPVAARVDEDDREAAVPGGELVHGHGLGEHDRGARRRDLVGDVVRRGHGVGGGDRGADARRGEEGEHELRRVEHQVHDHRAAGEPERLAPERRGEAAGEAVDLGVGADGARGAVDEAGAVGHLGEPLEAVAVQREGVGDGDVRELGPEDDLRRRLLPGGGGGAGHRLRHLLLGGPHGSVSHRSTPGLACFC